MLSYCLLKQIVRDFESSCEEILESEKEPDPEIAFLVETLKEQIPDSPLGKDKRLDKIEIIQTESLSEMFNIAEQCLNDPIKAVEFSIHNSLNYFLEDCGEMPELSNDQIKAKVLKFFFPDAEIPEETKALKAFLGLIRTRYKEADTKSLESLYLHRINRFLDDILELRAL